MLSIDQLRILREVMKLTAHPRRNAWHLNQVLYICRPYDEVEYAAPTGDEACHRLLLNTKLMSLSPDGDWCKLTDYGRALYDETEALQLAWEEAPIVALDDAEKDEIIINAGEVFRGKYFMLDVLKRARVTIRLHDNFCAHELLAWLYGVRQAVTIRILTSPRGVKQDHAFESLYRAFKKERSAAEVRLTDDVHDRKIIIDDREVFQVGESLKDIGRKGTTIKRLNSVPEHVALFDATWAAAKML